MAERQPVHAARRRDIRLLHDEHRTVGHRVVQSREKRGAEPEQEDLLGAYVDHDVSFGCESPG